jgi:ABC-type xylose transport system permease subunit
MKAVTMKINWREYRSILVLLAVMIVLTALTWDTATSSSTFLSARNLTNLARQVAINGILAVGMTYVILIGGIDLSVGSVVALSGVVAGILQVNLGLGHWEGGMTWLGAALSVLGAMGVGTASGMFNGFLITRYRIAPFIITLGLMVIARGLALIFAKGAAIAPLSEAFNELGQGYLTPVPSGILIGLLAVGLLVLTARKRTRSPSDWIFAGLTFVMSGGAIYTVLNYRGLPIPVIIFGMIAALGILILNRTRLGRYVLAIGGNAEAAWLAGVPIRKITFGIYVALGALAGLSGAILSARLNGSLPTAGELFELDAIAAVVIGGTSLLGGIGTVRGSILGAFFIGSLNNGMSLLDVSEFYQKVIKGLIIILAVWFDTRQSQGGGKVAPN